MKKASISLAFSLVLSLPPGARSLEAAAVEAFLQAVAAASPLRTTARPAQRQQAEAAALRDAQPQEQPACMS